MMPMCKMLWFLVCAIGSIYGYINLALHKPTEQSDEYNSWEGKYQSDKAVDGQKTNLSFAGLQCTISKDNQTTAYWWVDLETIHSIHDIRIYYRTENTLWNASNGYTARFLGFSVFVSNTTSTPGGRLCFHETNFSRATIPAVFNITCPVHGQYVIYYNERPQKSHSYSNELSGWAHNELCEVEVNGCKKLGVYGSNCSIKCPYKNCRYCHIETGSCQGCKPGYQGHRCTLPCSPFSYGEACKEKCGNCSGSSACHHISGNCKDGCGVGVYGDKCKTTCPFGWHGKNCSDKCSNCDRCDRFTGRCTSPCHVGWKGQFCTDACDEGMFGRDCAEKCGACLGYKQCNHINGSCIQGCDAGYKGELCENKCLQGTYGKNCEDKCSINCGIPDTCNWINGSCTGGCKPGWEPPQCNTRCTKKKYGINCSQPCGNCRNSSKCDHVNGRCPNGCEKGFKEQNCNRGCSFDTFGFDCMENCSTSCVNKTCDSVSGYCPKIKFTSTTFISYMLGSVIGGISGLVIACILIVVLILVFRRCSLHDDGRRTIQGPNQSVKENSDRDYSIDSKHHPSTEYRGSKQRGSGKGINFKRKIKGDEADVDEDELIHSENPYGDFYANETTIRDTPLNQLESVIAEKRKDKDDGFQREYATLPYGELYKCDDGKREENMVKNRYKTTFPYDHSRVKLRTNSGSDYINANYIEGAEWEREYIAAQGPKQNTLGDFWTMIWQENVTSIVMVTNLKEGTKVKCNQYWPEANKTTDFGAVSVKLIEEKQYAFYIVRRMSAMNNESKESRTVTQFHYTAWPDHGTPEPLCLVVFLDHVTRTGSNQNNSPIIVHCSAGIGRTGTYIALDALKRIGQKRKKINVAEYVKKMRENRMNMVQTYEQYMTIFLALNEIFKAPVNCSIIEDFTKIAGTMTMDEPANQSALRKEFQLLMKVRSIYTDADFKIAKEHCSDAFGTEVLPLDKYIVYLSTPVTNRGSFINAIYVQSFTNSWAFIVTKYPSEGDVVDFLRLVCEQESSTVICMDPLREIKSSKAWLPSQTSSSNSVPPFTIQFQSKTETDVSSSIVHIRQKNSKKPQTVTIIEPRSSIKTSGTHLDTSQLRSLVSVALSVETENPVIIVSSDGAALCGAFCAVHNAIQQINMDANVDVFTAVRQLQVRRPEFCSSLEEYRLVIKSVNDHIQRGSENIYSNQ
ncbi:receptor-type tyrosine-protein phosphatase epsilon-like isoform X4 [Saccostrea cucullata]|uniref:receptor-type tyrosine-protein phosphatase epsilon-like isoform X4 n=1 Tax=Saccostrea cuccullata TaxID=36930 RepID=UPI002ED14749